MYMGLRACHVDQYSDIVTGEAVSDDKTRPGHAHAVILQEAIASVDSLVKSNWQITTREIAVKMSTSKESVQTIMHERLQYKKVFLQWIPKHLTEEKI